MTGGDAAAQLGTQVWPTLWRAAPRPLLVVPVGSCEQHGPHLPLDTDTRIAVAVATGLVEAFAGASGDAGADQPSLLVAPPLAISASGEHAGFPGTLSLGTAVFEQVLVELVRSADWSSGVVLVNGHGGNAVAVQRAVATLTHEGRRVLAWWPRTSGTDGRDGRRDSRGSSTVGDAHAGITETSLMLAIAPHLVRLADARPGRTEPIHELAGRLRAEGVLAVSPNGVLGDPTGATAVHGRAVLTRWRIDLIAAVDEWWT